MKSFSVHLPELDELYLCAPAQSNPVISPSICISRAKQRCAAVAACVFFSILTVAVIIIIIIKLHASVPFTRIHWFMRQADFFFMARAFTFTRHTPYSRCRSIDQSALSELNKRNGAHALNFTIDVHNERSARCSFYDRSKQR